MIKWIEIFKYILGKMSFCEKGKGWLWNVYPPCFFSAMGVGLVMQWVE